MAGAVCDDARVKDMGANDEARAEERPTKAHWLRVIVVMWLVAMAGALVVVIVRRHVSGRQHR
jgi:hypothetical protein